jgi:CRP/FNR family nitrogen fixation transcriptional regulator
LRRLLALSAVTVSNTWAARDIRVANNLLSLTAETLLHAENHMLLLGRKNSLEKVATFLLEMEIS